MSPDQARTGDLEAGRGAARRVSVLVFNSFRHDSRVLNVARTSSLQGDPVSVLAVQTGSEPADETREGIRVLRFPFDPIYYRMWAQREAVIRPWRHASEVAAAIETRARDTRADPASILPSLGLLIVGGLWLAITLAYHAFGRLRRAAARALGRRSRWSATRSLEARYKAVLFAGPHAVRVATWTREVIRGARRGSFPPADVWHADDLETLPVALLLRRFLGGHVIYDSTEIYLELPGPLGMGPLRRALLARAEAWMARSADAVITINEPLADMFERRWRIERPVIVRNCPRLWSPGPGESPLRRALGERGMRPAARVVLMHGYLREGRGIEGLIAAARDMETVSVVLLGEGDFERRLARELERPEWQGRLFVLPMVPPEELLDWLRGADVSACLIEPTSGNHRLASPNKLYEAIAAGVPLLGSDFGPIAMDITRYGVGVTCDPTDPASIAQALRRLLEMPADELEAIRRNARRAHETELNWEHESARIRALYDRLAPRAAGAPAGGLGATG